MPRESSTDLFDLIKSLNQAEKGYIKKFALRNSGKGNNNYLKLFDAIDSQKIYDERALLRTEKYIIQLPNLKNYLYSTILNGLNNYTNNSNSIQFKKTLISIEILYEKALYDQCQKLLEKVKKNAYQAEDYTHLIEILNWEKKIISAKGITSFPGWKKTVQEGHQVLKLLKIINDYWFLYLKIREFDQKYQVIRNEQILKELDKYMQDPLLSNKEESALPWIAKSYLYGIYACYFHAKRDWIKEYAYRKKCLELINHSPEKIKENKKTYIIWLSNLLVGCISSNNYEESNYCIQQFKILRSQHFSENEGIALLPASGNELDFYLRMGEFKKGVELVHELEPIIKKYEGKINKEIPLAIYINSALVLFGAGDYSKALVWLNKVLADTSLNLRHDIIGFARLFNLILHFELKNLDMLSYSARSTFRFLSKRQELHSFEKAVLGFIRKIPGITTQKELRLELIELLKDPFEQEAIKSFDFISWLESKIENRPFAEIVKEKSHPMNISGKST